MAGTVMAGRRGRPVVDWPQERKDSTVSVNAWIVVGDQPAIGNLIAVARALGGQAGADGQVAAVVAGPRPVAETVAASGVDRVVWCGGPDDAPAEASALAVAERRRGRSAPGRAGRPQPRPSGCCSAPPPPGCGPRC